MLLNDFRRLSLYSDLMTTSEQIAEFTAFAKIVTQQEGEEVSLDEIYDRWWQKRHTEEDLAAIKAAVEDYHLGDRGELARDVLAELRSREEGNRQ